MSMLCRQKAEIFETPKYVYDAVRLEHVPQKWEPVLRKRTCSNKELEQDDDSKKSHPALVLGITNV